MPTRTISPAPRRAALTNDADPPIVRSLNYSQLRLLCESAAGIPALETPQGTVDNVLFFVDALGIHWVPEGSAVSDDVVRVPARIGRKFPVLASVELGMLPPAGAAAAAPQRRGQAGAAAGITVNAVAYKADAVFWSDAAVRKFVFPYAASCGGYELLALLHTVWTCYPSGHCKVVALMHVTAQSGEALPMERAFMVVFFRNGSDALDALTLEGFLRMLQEEGWAADTPRSEPSPPAAYQPGNGVYEYLDYGSLRAIAEAAESARATPEYFVVATGPEAGSCESTLAAVGDPGQLVIPACTFAVPADRRAPASVGFQVDVEILELAGAADALFWSTGAIEQFMFPYYASKRGLASPAELQDIRSAWDDTSFDEPLEPLEHGAASSARTDASPSGPAEGGDPGDPTIYGLVHIPRSLWVTPEEALAEAARQGLEERQLAALSQYYLGARVHWASALREVGVLHGPAGVRPRLLPLDEFRVLYPGRFA